MTLPAWQGVLGEIYGADVAADVATDVDVLLDRYRSRTSVADPLTERDTWLITYADQFQDPPRAPLEVLNEFLDRPHLNWITGVHVLPFYPWSSDDGFSVKDYLAVEPSYGDWSDVTALGSGRRLMTDAVLNHMSAESAWFRGFLAGDPAYAGFFRTADPDADLRATVRPRTTPLLTRFDSPQGPQWVWTTFSADQVDLDFRNPAVLLRVLEVLLEYTRHGVTAIRLDAVGFLWKEEGSSCLHLPQTHAIIHFLRLCLDEAVPGTILVTETNVPHDENIAYFGTSRRPEAHLVYQFALAPLVLDALLSGDAKALREWASGLEPLPPGVSFLNFLASHDGVGVRPVEGLIPVDRIQSLADLSHAAGGGLGERTLSDGSVVPYELNSTWFDLAGAGYGEADAIRRHLATHAAMFALAGVPLIYVHSLFGSSNDHAGFRSTGRPRSYNREKFLDVRAARAAIDDRKTRAGRVSAGLARMARLRAGHPAFHPHAPQQVLEIDDRLFAVQRGSGSDSALIVVNFSKTAVRASLPSGTWNTLIGPEPVSDVVSIPRWESVWLTQAGPFFRGCHARAPLPRGG